MLPAVVTVTNSELVTVGRSVALAETTCARRAAVIGSWFVAKKGSAADFGIPSSVREGQELPSYIRAMRCPLFDRSKAI